MRAWYIQLEDGREFKFYYDSNSQVSPFERIDEFDKGDSWSLDLSRELGNEFPIDTEDDSFVLIPKNMVKKIYYKG